MSSASLDDLDTLLISQTLSWSQGATAIRTGHSTSSLQDGVQGSQAFNTGHFKTVALLQLRLALYSSPARLEPFTAQPARPFSGSPRCAASLGRLTARPPRGTRKGLQVPEGQRRACFPEPCSVPPCNRMLAALLQLQLQSRMDNRCRHKSLRFRAE